MLPGDSTHSSNPFALSLTATGIVFLGLAARLWLYFRMPLINPDAFLYIQQAKALHFGRLGQLLGCYSYLSPYPIAVSIAYPLMGDWVRAAQAVNIFFSTASIVPLYWLLRRFFNDALASTTLLAFALLPSYALVGRDALRGPLFWAFALLGLYLFVLHLENRRPLLLLGAGICMGLAAWARVEGLLYVVASACFLPFSSSRKKTADVFIFLSPYLAVSAAGLLTAHLRGLDVIALLNPDRVLDLPRGVVSQYRSIRDWLGSIRPSQIPSISPYFFGRIKDLIWAIPAVALVVFIAETLLYIVFVFLLAGMVAWIKKMRSDRRIMYLVIVCLAALVLLYFHTLFMWHAASRLLAVFLLPAFVIIGAGIESFILCLARRFHCKPATGYAIVCALIFFAFVPKLVSANFVSDKLIFPEIGRSIAQSEAAQHTVTVCGAFKEVNVIQFYANLHTKAASCFNRKAFFHQANPTALSLTLAKGYDYFVWDQAHWGNIEPEKRPPDAHYRLEAVREWDSQRLGRVILFKVVK